MPISPKQHSLSNMPPRNSTTFNENDPKYSCMHSKHAVYFVLAFTISLIALLITNLFKGQGGFISIVVYSAATVCLFSAIYKKNRWLLIPYIAAMVFTVVNCCYLILHGHFDILLITTGGMIYAWCGFVVFKYFVYLNDLHNFKQTTTTSNLIRT